MYEIEYCDNPDRVELHKAGIINLPNFEQEFDLRADQLDTFVFLVDMFKIVDSCAKDLEIVTIDESKDFWKINKTLFNFINAVYGFKEYVNNFVPTLREITEKYYARKEKHEMYRFVCDFRDYIIHQSVIIKDYLPSKEEILFDIKEVKDLITEYTYPQEKYKDKAMWFGKRIDALTLYTVVIKGKKYLSMKHVVESCMNEIMEMESEIVGYLLENELKSIIQWFIGYIPKINNRYMYAFFVDKENGPESVREPNFLLEDFVRKMIKSFGEKSDFCCGLIDFLDEVGYTFFYDGQCDINEFIINAK